MKTFHGCIFMNKDELEKVGVNHPIKVEYYKIKEDKENLETYGIQVLKTEYLEQDVIQTETAWIENITEDETKADAMLEILKRNQVTPVIAEDVVADLMYQ